MCVTGHALLSALVRRVAEDGHAPTRREIDALRATGCSREDIERAFAPLADDRRDEVAARAREALRLARDAG